jgi:hypothetical protein
VPLPSAQRAVCFTEANVTTSVNATSSMLMGASRIMVMVFSVSGCCIWSGLRWFRLFGLGRENEKGRWDFPAASVRILDVGM